LEVDLQFHAGRKRRFNETFVPLSLVIHGLRLKGGREDRRLRPLRLR